MTIKKNPDPPSAPPDLKATSTVAREISLAWIDNSVYENNFILERDTSGSFSAPTALTIPANQNGYNDTGLNIGTIYYYRVKAVNSYGNSAWSNTSSVMTTSYTLDSDG